MTNSVALPEVRALTLWQPWASAMAYGTKRIENRRWATDYRGWVLIHAGLTLDRQAYDLPLARPFLKRPQPRGAIVAVSRLVDCHENDGYCTLWSTPGQWHWEFTDLRTLARPLPWPGARGLWTPTPQLIASVREVIAHA
ncbi:ASCH domain-containing protein [Streptomyces sp. TRM66268-LWL]|uniref:ASCH domain-containing protein n=1 Tax=Streptomyces polyasparticus TaxID=2767826 RepID=A0ABR7SN08_9ACTN|nr:ASCH domain-containing protein [Streptomyces polyasparticus]MBC9716857.1 ASCH domain-containing protein [Streptomyces polyasparticus]